MRGWKTTSTRPSRISAGTIAAKASAGSTSSSRPPARPPISDAPAQPQDPGALTCELAAVADRARDRPGHQPDRVGDVRSHRRDAEREQGRERDQRPRPHHGVDGSAPDPCQQNRCGFVQRHFRREPPGRRRLRCLRRLVARLPGFAALRGFCDGGLDGSLALRTSESPRAPLPPKVGGSMLPMSTRLVGPSFSVGMPAMLVIVEPRPSRALPISDGTIQTLFASPSAIFGIIWRYW